jgi:PadR family transcriptional regulator, regulatory protein PadR
MSSNQLLKGTLKIIILKLLSENKRMYGYEITQKVKEITGNKLNITEGALYPTLHQLENEQLLETVTEKVGERTRIYYSITKTGLVAFQDRIEDFQEFLAIMKSILSPEISFEL